MNNQKNVTACHYARGLFGIDWLFETECGGYVSLMELITNQGSLLLAGIFDPGSPSRGGLYFITSTPGDV
ncbi:hypothetical protein [Desulfovibrio inopinatus]|uniref:hypothetical protein n=1 Tax=Desulfovibrio inopinatus TaxID=102109 RepID=UPI0003FAA9AB|nr:hypothetical protein [Desulfovibrio inopinatus]